MKKLLITDSSPDPAIYTNINLVVDLPSSILECTMITAQDCIAGAHCLPVITEKWWRAGAYAPTRHHFSDFSWDFAL